MLAASDAMASLPLVGRHLEPLGAITAMSVWGSRLAPGFLAKSWQYSRAPREARKAARAQTEAVMCGACAASWRTRTSTSSGPRRTGLRRSGARGATAATYTARLCATAGSRRSCWTSGAARICRYGRRRSWSSCPAVPGCMADAAAGLRADVTAGRDGVGMPVGRLPGLAAPPLAGATSPTSRPRSRGRAPTSTSSVVTAISLRWRVVRPADTFRAGRADPQ